jgi:sugar-specific transcriptional regulator TrmB
MDYAQALSAIGLSSTEAKIYLFLAHNGQCSAPQIQAALNVEKVPTYRALNALKKRGYVQAHGESRNQRFAAAPLPVVLAGYDQQMKSLLTARNDLESLVRDLADKQHALYKDNRITAFDGLDGYRLWMDARLQGNPEIIREFGRNAFVEQFFDSSESFDDYMDSYIQRRVAKGIRLRSLGSHVRQRSFDITSAALLKEQRLLEIGAIDGILSIFGDKFGFYSRQGDRYIGVVIDDPMLARLATLLFDALWERAE